MSIESGRRILRVRDGGYELAAERAFESEAELHRAIAAHPEVLPAEDLQLGPLVPVASELDLGAGPVDLLCVDARGRLVVVEFKRDSAGSNVREVIAQLLEYGSALWGTSIERLEERAGECSPGFDDGLVEHVGEYVTGLGVDEPFDDQTFLKGLETSLEAGDFAFMYVAKDLDRKTRRVMTYLAEGPQMRFFAVEVDLYEFDSDDRSEAVLVPRTAFVPSWVAERGTSVQTDSKSLSQLFEEAGEDVWEAHELLSALTDEVGAIVEDAQKSRNYRPVSGRPGVSLEPEHATVRFWLESFHRRGDLEAYEDFRDILRYIHPSGKASPKNPGVPVAALLEHWEHVEQELVRPYLVGRLAHVNAEDEADSA